MKRMKRDVHHNPVTKGFSFQRSLKCTFMQPVQRKAQCDMTRENTTPTAVHFQKKKPSPCFGFSESLNRFSSQILTAYIQILNNRHTLHQCKDSQVYRDKTQAH